MRGENDMFVNQLSVFIENREGRLEQVLETLKNNNINIISLSLADSSDFGLLRMIVSNAELGKRGMRPENLKKIALALDVSADYLLTGDIVDKDLLILSKKLEKLTPAQLRLIEDIVDDCIKLNQN
jgi:acetolactate synthase small subunit